MTSRRRPASQKQKRPQSAWHLPEYSPAMLRLATVGALCLVVLGGVMFTRAVLNNPENLRISQIDIQGSLQYVKDTELRKVIEKYSQTNLYLLDDDALEADLELLPWVRSISLRKLWPTRLVVEVEEQSPVAFWGTDRLMNQYGELFQADLPAKRGIFPLLYSPEDKGREMGERYLKIRDWFKGLPLEIAELTEDESNSWRIKIKNGPEVLVGNDDQERRIQRFKVGFQQELASKFSNIRRIDLRYTNGFSIEWKQPPISGLEETVRQLGIAGESRRS